MKTHQLTLSFPSSDSYEKSDFFVSDSNREAYQSIISWPQWSHFCTIIYGPEGSGKTHLSKIFQGFTKAIFYENKQQILLSETSLIIDNLNLKEGLSLEEEETLFHLYNNIKSNHKNLLILTRSPPVDWTIRLPDLKSRLRSASLIKIHPPTDDLLFSVYAKLFSDFQIVIPPHIIDYLVKKTSRSLENASRIVETLTQASFSLKKAITIPFIHKVLEI